MIKKYSSFCFISFNFFHQVLNTIGFCVSTLEQLQNWATFAIFPQDEGHSDRYLNFVEFKYKCIIEPLRTLYRSMFHCDPPREGGIENGDGSPDGESTIDSLPAGADARSLQVHNQDENDLKNVIENMTKRYIIEGQMIRDEIEKRLAKNRKDVRILYRWGQTSLMDLHDLLDDTLADELYFSVRGKMARILCSMSEVEETEDKIEKTLVSQLEGNMEMKSSDSKSDARSDHSGNSGAGRAGHGHSSQGQNQNQGHSSHDRGGSGRDRNSERENDQRYDRGSDHQVHYQPSPYDRHLDNSPERQHSRSSERPQELERPPTRLSERPPPPVPPLWSSSDDAPHPGSHSRHSRQSPPGRSQRSPLSGRSPSPKDNRISGYHRQHSCPDYDSYSSAAQNDSHESRYSKYVDTNDSRYADLNDAKGVQSDFPQPGSILRARSEQSRDEIQFSSERPGHLALKDKSEMSPRSESVLDRDPYRPPLQKQATIQEGKIPVADYPPLPTKDQPQRQSTVLESSAYPDLPGQRSISDRGDYRRTDSQASFNGDSNEFSFSARDLGKSASTKDLENLDSLSGTPEPPTSPRPRGLVNHPKIVKDMLQSFSLPNKFLQNTW